MGHPDKRRRLYIGSFNKMAFEIVVSQTVLGSSHPSRGCILLRGGKIYQVLREPTLSLHPISLLTQAHLRGRFGGQKDDGVRVLCLRYIFVYMSSTRSSDLFFVMCCSHPNCLLKFIHHFSPYRFNGEDLDINPRM